MDKVTPEMEAAYVAWDSPAEVELTMPRVLGLIRAAFFAGWKARDERPLPEYLGTVKCSECTKIFSRNRIDDHLANAHNIR